MVHVTIINVVPVLTEVCTGHSLDSAQMTILMDVEQISSTTFTTPLFLVFTNSVYDRLSVETADNDGEAVL